MSLNITSTPSFSSSTQNDPNKQLASDAQQLWNDRQQMEDDYNAIQAALTQMLADLKSKDPTSVFMALMVALYQIFPAIEAYKGDNIKQLADSENIASDLRTFITGGETAFNKTDGSNASDLFYFIQDLNGDGSTSTYNVQGTANGTSFNESWLSFLTDKTIWGSNTPLDATDEAYLVQSVADIKSQFGADWGNTAKMQSDIANWYNQSSTTMGEPAPQIKAIQGDCQQATQAVSTLATSTQTNEQFYTQEFNQIIGIDNSLLQGEASQSTALVQNQKTN
jgi:hypothetical protein